MKERLKSVPVRLGPKLRRKVRCAARRLGASAPAVIRMSILAQLPEIEAGAIEIPIVHKKLAGGAGEEVQP